MARNPRSRARGGRTNGRANSPRPADPEAAWLIVGLGNPGPEYRDTYHNVGFRVVDLLARRWGVSLRNRIGKALAGHTRTLPRRVLVEPQTFMNLSGTVLPALLAWYGEGARVLAVSDDAALRVGKIRIRERGSAGGHNGLKSIGSALGSDEYFRIRVGILPALQEGAGAIHPGMGEMRDFVLSPVTKADRELLDRTERLAAEAVEFLLERGVREAMSRYNGMDLGPARE